MHHDYRKWRAVKVNVARNGSGVILFSLWAVALAVAFPATAEQSCRPLQLTSLDLAMGPDRSVWVPAAINGQATTLKLDTGGSIGMLDSDTAKQFGLETFQSRRSVILFGNIPTNTFTRDGALQIGSLPPSQMKFAIFDSTKTGGLPKRTVAADTLSKYDLEIDFGALKLNIFRQDRCGTGVVQGTSGSIAALPMQSNDSGKIFVSVTLDGKPLTAVVDTGSPTTRMSLQTALDVFGVTTNDPALKADVTSELNGKLTPSYRYPFKALNFDGIEMDNPAIGLLPGNSYGSGMPQLLLGLDVLRKLHLYIAYDDEILYVSPANRH